MTNDNESRDIDVRSVTDLVNSLNRCKGHYSFLIGAGTSKRAGIPTSGELVSRWQSKLYIENHDVDDIEEVEDGELQDWATSIESDEKSDSEHSYGFWFEKRYTTRGERRQFIQQIVNEKEPTFGHIVLASMMADEYVPLTLTPNFDDLLYDAFYLFLEEKPLLINHNAIAPEFKLTQERPAIIKLHGDYLYDNLKNTNSETAELEKNMNTALTRSLDEYGMVVVGYGGNDESIMNIINSEELQIPDYGLYWCTRDRNNISNKAKSLLKQPNTFLIEIDGFEDLFTEIYSGLKDLSIPLPHEIKTRSREREQLLMERIQETEGTEPLKLLMTAQNYIDDGEFETGIEILTNYIEQHDDDEISEGELSRAYYLRGIAYMQKGEPERAIDEYSKILERKDRPASHDYLNRAEARLLNQDTEGIVDDIIKSNEVDDRPDDIIPLFLRTVAKIIDGEDFSEELDRLEERIQNNGHTTWEFETMRTGLENIQIDEDKKTDILDLIDLIESKQKDEPILISH